MTQRHFPQMEHVGDITKLKGGQLPPVDIITFGSPCQDLSTANANRQGLTGARSGLFMEAIRIIEEMRGVTNGLYPRYAIFENVTGAFSSAKGRDFRAILQAFCRIKDGNAAVPEPPNCAGRAQGKWTKAGLIVGDGYSIAYRTLSADLWGVPQRRRRIFAVADFGGGSAGKILFERQGLLRHFKPGGPAWQSLTNHAQRGTGGEGAGVGGNCLNSWDTPVRATSAGGIGYSGDATPTLKAASGANMVHCLCQPEVYTLCGLHSGAMLSSNPNVGIYNAQTSRTLDQNGGNPACNQGGMLVCEPKALRTLTPRGDSNPCVDRGRNIVAHPEVTGTLCASGAGLSRPAGMASETDLCVAYRLHGHEERSRLPGNGVQEENSSGATAFTRQRSDLFREGDVSSTQTARQCKDFTDLICEEQFTSAIDCRNYKEIGDISGTLQAKNAPGYSLNYQNPVRTGYIVRRLTPTECERLQGYPDGWTAFGADGAPISDTRRYQMLGNSVAIPCVAYVLEGIALALGYKEVISHAVC